MSKRRSGRVICKGCGGTYESDKVICPYCGRINDEGMNRANQKKEFERELATATERASMQGGDRVIKKVTVLVCSVLLLLTMGTIAWGVYYQNYDEIKARQQMSGKNYNINVERITNAINNENYLEAITIARTIDPGDYKYTNFDDELSEELQLLEEYFYVTNQATIYFVSNFEVDRTMFDSYNMIYSRNIYDALITTQGAKVLKEKLCQRLDLYLKYYYCLTDKELDDLKKINDPYEFTINGKNDFSEILMERAALYYE